METFASMSKQRIEIEYKTVNLHFAHELEFCIQPSGENFVDAYLFCNTCNQQISSKSLTFRLVED